MWRKEKAQLIGEINQLSMTVVGDFDFGTNTKTDPQKQNQFHAEEEEEAKPNSRCNILWERTLVLLLVKSTAASRSSKTTPMHRSG